MDGHGVRPALYFSPLNRGVSKRKQSGPFIHGGLLFVPRQQKRFWFTSSRTPISSPYTLAESPSSPRTCSWPGGSEASREGSAEPAACCVSVSLSCSDSATCCLEWRLKESVVRPEALAVLPVCSLYRSGLAQLLGVHVLWFMSFCTMLK